MTATPVAAESESFAGTVIRPIYRGASFSVVQVRDEESGKTIPLCGHLPDVNPGERIAASGVWESSAKYGRQFRAESAKVELPLTETGLVDCLSKLVDGVGPGISRQLVEVTGGVSGALAYLRSDATSTFIYPSTSKRVNQLFDHLRQAWQERQAAHELEAGLASLGLTPALRARVRGQYGSKAVEVCRLRPYELAMDVEGFGFKRADDVAKAAGVSLDSVARKTAALLYALSEDAAGRGHVFMTKSGASRAVSKLCELEASAEDMTAALSELVRRDRIIVSEASGAVGLRHLIEAEREVARRVKSMLARDEEPSAHAHLGEIASASDGQGPAPTVTLVAEQIAAVDLARERRLLLLTGGPGVGKTTTTKAICELWARSLPESSIALAAPTGRAARRLAEATGRPAMTIHRLLGYSAQLGGFEFNEGNHLKLDALLLDESSMIDVELMRSVLVALRPGCRLVLVGDADQLPPVGPGAPFRDMVNAAESAGLPLVRLSQVHRQAAGSRIIAASRDVLHGKAPSPSPQGDRSDGALFLRIKSDEAELAAEVVELVFIDLQAFFGIHPQDVQVVSPMRKGGVGVDALNRLLQEQINPRLDAERYLYKLGEREVEFRVGDRVMQTKNDYGKGVVNGELGSVAATLEHAERDRTAPVLSVRFLDGDGEKLVPYTRNELSYLDLAYCTTVHKVQGAEFPAVIVVCHDSHAHMLERALLYTALTRAKKLCVLVGTTKAMARAAKSARSDARRTTLGGLLG